MSELTAGQLWERREGLESAGATLLGKMLFEFARLDVAVDLCAVWVDGGRRLEVLTAQISEFGFNKKLEFIEGFVNRMLPHGSSGQNEYAKWLEQAHSTRQTRNELVHGRWGVDPLRAQVVNVIGLPTSPEQREVRYTLADLEEIVEDLKRLQVGLNELRSRWPL